MDVENITKENTYKENTISKTNIEVATLNNNKTFYSVYNPQRDIDFFCSNEKIKNSGYICIAGIGNGYHLKQLSENFPDKFILAFEINKTSIDYLLTTNDFSFCKNKNILLTTLEDLENKIIETYTPSIYDNFYFTNIKPWMDYHQEYFKIIEKKINKAISIISSDFSVQTHFGKVWMHNILENTKFLLKNKTQNVFIIDNSKTAVVIGAGPSLDNSLNFLNENKEKLFIISTDTSYPALIKNKIIPQVVVSIDAQIYSREHFIGINKEISKDTIFLLDICANSSIVKKIHHDNILFFTNGHPLANYIEEKSKSKFLRLNSGRGTVTSVACDFATKCNFENIILLGTDFSFYKNKPYTKTTYLEKQFLNQSNKIKNLETQYTNLMLRTEIIKNQQGNFTSQLLDEYKVAQQKMIEHSTSNFYIIEENCNPMNLPKFHNNFVNTKISKKNITLSNPQIKNDIFNELLLQLSDRNIQKNFRQIYPILPLLAWGKNKKIDFFSTINIAKKLIHNYTIRCYEF